MIVTVILLLVAVSWALWLFGNTFKSNKAKLIYSALVLASISVSYGLYYKLGANKEIESLANQHQQLHQNSLQKLADLVTNKTISVNELLAELRLRLEANPDDASQWMKLGELMILSTQSEAASQMSEQEAQSMIQLAKQAFVRAAQLGNQEKQITTRIEVAKTYLNYSDFENALTQLNLVLLKNNQHEGALMMKGLTESRLNQHQNAISTWTYLLSRRDDNSESASLINSLIKKEQQKIEFNQTQFIEITIDNFSNLDLQSFTKAFALVRPIAGGAPIAVKAIDISELTATIRLTPENLMLEGTNFWQVIDLKVEIRLSKSGFAKSEAGDKFGVIAPVTDLKPMQKFHISIDNVVN